MANEQQPSENRPKPLPITDDLTRPFWDGAARQQLMIQRCQECHYFNHPPRSLCDACQSQHLTFVPVSGYGTIYSYTVMHQPTVAGFEKDLPYINVLAELDEQPRLFMVSFLPMSELEKIRIGARVTVHFEKVNEEITLPQFRVGP
ncbi:MAG: Zn-ribbon domain-containing OB-fold protein [Candidatus Binatia bacterium]